jgi:hypothetical protein
MIATSGAKESVVSTRSRRGFTPEFEAEAVGWSRPPGQHRPGRQGAEDLRLDRELGALDPRAGCWRADC